MKVVDDITQLVGETPIVKLNKIVPDDAADVYVKMEMFNPSKSVKDRAAINMVKVAENEGYLKPGATIIEPTSGNTGIGLAMIASAKGYQSIFVMPDNSTQERITILEAYGGKVYLTPSEEKMPGSIRKAMELQEQIPGSFIPQQFENQANPDVHRFTTAPEIYDQMDGDLDAFVCTAGTGGTVTGTGETLKEKIPGLHVAVVEPKGSPVLSGGEPGKHKLVGTSPGFIPDTLNTNVYDEIVLIDDDDAINTLRELSQTEGIFLGPSGGGSVYAAIQVAKKLGKGKKVVCVAPDTGERYLSMNLFD